MAIKGKGIGKVEDKGKNTKVKIRSLLEFYKIPFALLSTTGLKLVYWDANDRMSLGEKFGLAVMIFNISTQFPAKINFLINGKVETNLDYTALTIYWLFALNSVVKLVAILLGRSRIDFVLKRMALSYPKTSKLAVDYDLDRHFSDNHRLNMFLALFHMITTTMFNAFPLMQSIFDYIESGEFSYRFPYMMKYPFDIRRPIRYGFTYTFQVLGAYNSSLVFLGSDLVLVTSIRLINMNFKYLMKWIKNFEPKHGTQRDINEFEKIIKFHEEIFIYTEKIDEMFNISIFMNYFATAMVVCLLGYQVVSGTEFFSLVKFCTFIFSTATHIYLIASAGQDLTDLSMEVSDAFFHHRWYHSSVSYQRLLPMALARAQRPAHLNAFKFFVISMESFKTLLSTSYQFFALINTQLEG